MISKAEKQREYSRRHYRKYRDKILQDNRVKAKAFYWENREARLAYAHRYYTKNFRRIINQVSQRNHKNRSDPTRRKLLVEYDRKRALTTDRICASLYRQTGITVSAITKDLIKCKEYQIKLWRKIRQLTPPEA